MAGEERENGTVSRVFGKLLYTGRYKGYIYIKAFSLLRPLFQQLM